MQILLGCGANRERKIQPARQPGAIGEPVGFWSPVTLDIEPRHKPDIVHDMNSLPLPFPDDSAEEIHAYEVLEHVGRQGDAAFFFAQWSDFWRILKPGGMFFGSVPRHDNQWALGDPSHTRVIPACAFVFLDQDEYQHVGRTTMSDFRSIYTADFTREAVWDDDTHTYFVLKAVKPSRCALLAKDAAK